MPVEPIEAQARRFAREELSLFTSVRVGAALVATTVLFLTACGNSNNAEIRLLNVSQGYSSLDLYAGSTKEKSAVTSGTLSAYFGLGASTYTLKFTVSGVTTALASSSVTFTEKTHQTFVAYGDTGRFATLEIGEDTSAPSSGTANVELVNAAPDAGPVDVYFTASTTLLEDVSPTFSDVAGGSISSAGFVNLTSGTYRMRVTGTGSKTDIRLDVASVTLSSGSISSVIVSDTSGGVLVNASILPQQGSLTADDNTSARVRAVNGVSGSNAVDVSVGGTSLLASAPSATIGDYNLITAGTAAVSLTVGGTAVTAASQTLTAGADYTLLIWTDSSGTTQETLLSETNGLATSGDAKIHLVNSMSGLGDPLSMTVSYTPEAESIALGAASAVASVTDGTSIPLGVTDTTTSTTLYTNSAASLASQGVYTLFMFGTSAAPVGTVQSDR
jgi:Domain of unknown function (DUF4397)